MAEHGYDLIGDIHGQYKKLTGLLQLMGYTQKEGVYSHPQRKVIFLGDFIDRGPQQKAVLRLVMDMVNQGHAYAVMGNHEYNALAFHTEHPDMPGVWLRPRSDKNIHQHLAFLHEFLHRQDAPTLDDALDFFRSLPLWIDLPGLRVIHACWDPQAIAVLKPLLNSKNCLTENALIKTSDSGSEEFEALEVVLKGPEVGLPEGVFFVDKNGIHRKKMRLRWWFEGAKNLSQQVVDRGEAVKHLRNLNTVPVVGYPADQPPLFYGHYWFVGKPQLVRDNLACLDYSAARSGPLVAYRWDGEKKLTQDHFIYSDSERESLKVEPDLST